MNKIKSKNSVKRRELLKEFKARKGKSYIQNALEYFQKCLGETVISEELAQLPGKSGNPISHNIRRIFELRDEKGFNILNHKDNERTGLKLKINEWVLFDQEPDPQKIRQRGINKRIMFEVFSRDGSACRICGRTPKEDDLFRPGHRITLHVGHIIAHKRKNGEEVIKWERVEDMEETKGLTAEDFLTMCNVCNEGAKNTDIKLISLLERIENVGRKEKRKIYDYLKKEFK